MDRKRFWKIVCFNALIIGFLVLVYGALNYFTGEGCPVYLLTGVPCPMCGMTRAHLAALRLDFKTAFDFHPLFPVGVPYILLLINGDSFTGKLKRISEIAIIAITVLLLVRYAFVLLGYFGITLF